MKRLGLLLSLVLCTTTGCITPSIDSMNIQRSAIRGTGDTATSVALDSLANTAEVDAVKEKTKEIVLSVQLFLKDGKVADLTIPEITGELKKLIPEKYQFLLDIAIAQIQGMTVDVQKIGVDNVERINSVCVGILRGCDLYDISYRPVTDEAKAKQLIQGVRQYPELEDRFGARLKKEMGVK